MAEFSVGIVTVSDRGAAGRLKEDTSGVAIRELLQNIGGQVREYLVVPDEKPRIQQALRRCVDELGLDLVVTTGGTGLSPRDVTPEATAELLEREVPGMAEAMRAAGLTHTPRAMLSRGVCGIRRRSLIVNLPGSQRAVREALEVILPVIPHALEKLAGDSTPCGGE